MGIRWHSGSQMIPFIQARSHEWLTTINVKQKNIILKNVLEIFEDMFFNNKRGIKKIFFNYPLGGKNPIKVTERSSDQLSK